MAAPDTALQGIRVLDLGRYHACPRAGLELAKLGAEVIKIEHPGGEESRVNGPYVRGQSAYWVQYNGGKKSLTLDLRREEGREILRDLVKISDVFMQNFRPGIIAEMGFSYEELHKLNPRIIMLNVSGYGQSGPYRDRPGFDVIGQAFSGMTSLNGFPGGPPLRDISPVIDRITSLHGTIGVLAALMERNVSGEGQAIDVCLIDTGYSLMEIPITHYLGTGVVDERRGNRGPWPINDIYKTKDGWVIIMAFSKDIFTRLCNLIGKPEWSGDPRFVEVNARAKNKSIFEEALNQWLSTRTMEETADIMSNAGIPCAPANDTAHAAHNPQLFERECLVEVPDHIAGTIHVSGKFIKMSRSKTVIKSIPTPGEHTEEILQGLLHYTTEQVQQLQKEKII